MKEINGIEQICAGALGQWIDGLFIAIKGLNPTLTFPEHKEAFFWLLEKLLSEGKIGIKKDVSKAGTFKPDDLSLEQRALEETYLWHAAPAEIAAYFREIFPKHVTDEHDAELNFFWYSESPYIVWKTPQGTWLGS
jgi:hypothetical protein